VASGRNCIKNIKAAAQDLTNATELVNIGVYFYAKPCFVISFVIVYNQFTIGQVNLFFGLHPAVNDWGKKYIVAKTYIARRGV
jgi:hypothetical protein